MGRRVSNGVNGNAGSIGQISITSNTISTTQSNTDLILDPQGSGLTKVVSHLLTSGTGSAGGEIRLGDADTSNYISLRAPASVGTNRTLTLPSDYGTSGNVLTTDGSGTLSWGGSSSLSVVNETASGSTYYPTLTAVTTDTTTTSLNRSSTKLTFVPSTGTLYSAIGQHPIIYGDTTSGANLVLRSTSNASKGQVYIDETTASSSTTSGALRVGGGVGVAGQLTCATLSATTITETSSIALKENLMPITNALDIVTSLQAFTYDRKDGTSKSEPGLIAEEVFKILPNIVQLDANGNPEGVKYTKLTAYLIECVKTLREEIDTLKGRI